MSAIFGFKKGNELMILLGEFTKKDHKLIQISIQKYFDPDKKIELEFFDMRYFFINGKSKRIPTKNGVSFSPKRLKEIQAMMEKAIEYFKQKGYYDE